MQSILLTALFLVAAPLAADAPELVAIAPADGTITPAGEVRLTGRVSDAVKLVINGREVALAADGSFATEPLALGEGEQAFVLVAESASGERLERLHHLVRDSRAPEIRLNQPARPVVDASPVVVRGRAIDAHLTEVLVDGRPAALERGRFEASLALAEGERTVVIRARDAAGHESVEELRLALDTQPPRIDVRVDGGVVEASYGRPVRPEISVSEDARLEITLDGSPFRSGEEVARPGLHTLEVRATDAAGHRTLHRSSFEIDLTPPRFAPLPKSIHAGSSATTLEGLVSGAREVRVNGRRAELDGERFRAQLTGLARGGNRVVVEAVDAAGNSATAELEIKVDTNAPVVTVDSPANGAVVASSPITVSGTVTDDGTVTEVKIGTTFATLEGSQFTIAGVALVEGPNPLTVEASDDSANISQTVHNVTLDTTLPTIQILAGGTPIAPGAVFPGLVTPEIQVDDATEVSVTSTLDSLAWTSNTSVTSAGSHLLEVTATDAAGHSAAASVSFTVEAAPPIFASLSPEDGTVQSAGEVTLHGRVMGAASLTVDGAAVALVGDDFSTGPYDLTADAAQTFTLAATSPGGQTAQTTVTVTRDVTSPALAFSAPADGAVVSTPSISVSGTASDSHLDRVTVNGRTATLSAGTFQADSISLAEGESTLAARAVDLAGNVTEIERVVVLDTRPPVVEIVDPAPGTVVGAASYTLNGGSRIRTSTASRWRARPRRSRARASRSR